MGTPSSYAEVLRRGVEHAPVKQIRSEEAQQAADRLRAERIEPELVVAMTNQGRYAAIHNTRAIPEETLPEGLIRNKIGFLLSVEPVKAKIDAEK
jgi:hypothetical protein